MEHIFWVAKKFNYFWLCLVFLKCFWENKVDAGSSPPPPPAWKLDASTQN